MVGAGVVIKTDFAIQIQGSSLAEDSLMPLLAKAAKIVRDMTTYLLPVSVRGKIRAFQRKYKLQSVPVGSVNFGTLRRLSPISPVFGIDRDLISVERYYIDKFLEKHAADKKDQRHETQD